MNDKKNTPPLPTVSVIMTVYNGEQFVSRAIRSIQQQTWSDFEFIIVNDGSKDNTQQILLEAQASDPRIRVISQPRVGRAKALNIAWTQANGQYIANLDADDTAMPDRLEKQLSFFRQHSEVGMLSTACKLVYKGEAIKEKIVIPPLTNSDLRRALMRRNPIVHSSVMLPRHVLEEIGGYNESLRVVVDYDLWVHIACQYPLASLADVTTIMYIRRKSYFRHTIPSWEKRKAIAGIRWYAWQKLHRDVTELHFVVLPITRWLYGWSKKQLGTNQLLRQEESNARK